MQQITFAIFLTCCFASCSDFQMMVDKVRKKTAGVDDNEYIPLPGEAASGFLSKTLSNKSVESSAQVEALNVAVADAEHTSLVERGLALADSESSITASSAAFDEIVGGEKKKTQLVPDLFQKLDTSFFKTTKLADTDYSGDTINWGSYTDSSFTIPALDRMPVRDQGRRGTCASFAGIGLIEALIIQQSSTKLPFKEIDLSEQRFYFLSKPDSWSSGGDPAKQGSDSGTGFMSSSGELSGYAGPQDTSGVAYNIPLEGDCAYNPKVGTNDLQTPLSDNCKSKGVVRVTKFTSWAGAVGPANEIDHAQQIYDELRRNKAVIVYTKLSSNWEKNDGLITLKAAGGSGDTGHAAGHAYLVVGAKKLDENAFPGEGGMCFIIRNSWGTGWGVKGLSCMTLKWFNAWRFQGPFPTADEVQLIDDAKSKITIASQRPANSLPEPDKSTIKNKRGGILTRRKGRVVVGFAPDLISNTVASPYLPQSYGADALTDLDIAALTAEDMSYGKLITDDDQTYKMLYTATSTQLVLRGILSGDSTQTHNLELKRSGNQLIADLEGRGETVVGEISEEATDDGAKATAIVCGTKYASLCDLHYDQESNELLVGLSQVEAKRQVSQPPYDWKTLQIAGYGFQMSRPASALTKFDVRLMKEGAPSTPQRLKLDPNSGDISHKGAAVGNLNQGALCSGPFSSACRVVTTGDKFEIFSKSR